MVASESPYNVFVLTLERANTILRLTRSHQRVCTGCKLVLEKIVHVDERAIYILVNYFNTKVRKFIAV